MDTFFLVSCVLRGAKFLKKLQNVHILVENETVNGQFSLRFRV